MDLANPLATVTPTLDAAVLQALSATTGVATGAHVHRMAGTGSADGVRRVLARLVLQGIVLAEDHAHATLYRLNRDHVAAEPIIALTRLRIQILNRITAAINDWPILPAHASLFGSFARSEAGPTSDIDILLVNDLHADDLTDDLAQTWQSRVDRLAADVQRWTGNNAHVVDISHRRLAVLIETGDPLIDSWRADHVHLAGQGLLELLRTERLRAKRPPEDLP